MIRTKIVLAALGASVAIVAHSAVRDASAASSELVARAGGQELSLERLASLLASAQVPLKTDIAHVISDLWIDYQLLGIAGSRGDSLLRPDIADDVMWWMIDSAKSEAFYEIAKKNFAHVDTAGLEQRYARGDLLAAQHILIMMPENGAGLSERKQDSLRQVAEAIRLKVTSANFNAMADQYTEEPGGKERHGELGVLNPDSLVREFANAVRALKPGEVSPVVRTAYGYHIIRRNLLSEVRDEYLAMLGNATEDADSKKFIAGLETERKLTLMPDIVARARAVFLDPDAALNDKAVMATSADGDFTVGRFARHLESYPPSTRAQIKLQAATLPDSVVTALVRAHAGRDLIVEEADKAHATVDSATMIRIRGLFRQMVVSTSVGLKLDPTALSDSAATEPERRRLAAIRVEATLDRLFGSNGKDFVDMPPQLATALRKAYPWALNSAALERAVTRAVSVRAALDSTRARSGR